MVAKRAHLIINGRVQGVFYRQGMKEMANIFGVKGWVRNLPSGEVEAEIEGDNSAVDNLLEWCRQGPPAAAVDYIKIDWEEPKGNLKDFIIKY